MVFELETLGNATLFVEKEYTTLSINGIVGNGIVRMVEDEYYTCLIELVDLSGPLSLSLRWIHSGMSEAEVIPSTNLFLPNIDANSPVTELIGCYEGRSLAMNDGVPG